MKNYFLKITCIIFLTFFCVNQLVALNIEKLAVSSNARFLTTESGAPFFPIADTAWQMPWKLSRDDVLSYLQTRKDQKYNIINMVAFAMENTAANVYGDQPFQISGGQYIPTQPITTPGNDPNNSTEYDYWDHLEFIIKSAQDEGLYVVLLPAWGSRIAGAWGSGTPTDDIILDVNNASNYASWISARFSNYTNIIWMLGGDRSAVYDSYDYRPVFRKMADGVLAGNSSRPLLMSYHPQKWKPNSSEWFHNDSWLSFNSIQDEPSDQILAISNDYSLLPTKPTWLFEGGYEERSKPDGVYTDWQVRFQAYQTVFAGGFGYTYGHMSIWDFASDWKSKMQSPGAKDMQYLSFLMASMSSTQFFDLIPDQSLIDGDTGSMTGSEGMFSTCIVATRTISNDLAMVYSANGRNLRVKMSQLADTPMRALWFNPRDGAVTLISSNIVSGAGAPIHEFDPPGATVNGNDYVLVLDLGSGLTPDPPPGPEPDPDHGEAFFGDTFNNVSSGTINDETTASNRQFGTLAPLDYTGDGDSLSHAIIGDSSKPGKLILESEPYISPNHNFTDIGTNFVIEFDVKLNRLSGTAWAGLGLHIGAEDPHDVMNGNNTGINWWLQKGDGGQVLLSAGNVVALGNRSLFHNSELAKFEDEPVHVNCVVSTKSFGGSDKVTTACFVNGEPITAQQRNGSSGYGTVFELNQSFTNNYIIYGFSKDASVSCNFDIDNFIIRKTEPEITDYDWTDDASSLISSSKTYTHAVNCFGNDVTINGVQFTGAPDGSQPYDDDITWVMTDYHNNWGIGTGTESTAITGSGANLATSYFYSRISSTLMLFNLTPGENYTLILYNNSTASGPDTRLVPSDSGAAVSVLNQNKGKGNIFRYTYTAPANGTFSITFDNSPVDSGDAFQNWRLYAFSNEVAIPECSLFFGFLSMAFLFVRRLK